MANKTTERKVKKSLAKDQKPMKKKKKRQLVVLCVCPRIHTHAHKHYHTKSGASKPIDDRKPQATAPETKKPIAKTGGKAKKQKKVEKQSKMPNWSSCLDCARGASNPASRCGGLSGPM